MPRPFQAKSSFRSSLGYTVRQKTINHNIPISHRGNQILEVHKSKNGGLKGSEQNLPSISDSQVLREIGDRAQGQCLLLQHWRGWGQLDLHGLHVEVLSCKKKKKVKLQELMRPSNAFCFQLGKTQNCLSSNLLLKYSTYRFHFQILP